MNNQNTSDKDSLPQSILDRAYAICDCFEQAWQAGQQPKINDYLGKVAEQERPSLFRKLLAAELKLLRENGKIVVPEIYQQQFPEYASVAEDLLSETVTMAAIPPTDGNAPVFKPAKDTGTPAPASPTDLPARLGSYRIEEEIARGGMGRVVRIRDDDFDRPLAMKVLLERNSDLEDRFLREARLTGVLQHPGIPPVHALGRLDDGRPYFIMKLIQGRSLQTLLRDRSSPSADLPRFITIFEQICQTVGYAHDRGVIHRDLKPANIMVGAFGEVQVMDWGLAKLMKFGPAEERSSTESSDAVHGLRRTVTTGHS
jgi:hypothetical protein